MQALWVSADSDHGIVACIHRVITLIDVQLHTSQIEVYSHETNIEDRLLRYIVHALQDFVCVYNVPRAAD